MKRTAVHVLLFLVTPIYLFGQSSVTLPPSPEARALFKFTDYPVNHSTGVPEIKIPLYRVTSGSLSLPLDINYHASGIKVGDVASAVGLGWAINAGGTISRTVMDCPDERGYLVSQHYTMADLFAIPNADQKAQLIDQMVGSYYDNESDFYSYNVSGGIGGQFFYNLSNQIIHRAYSNNLISRDLQNDNFLITDEQGNQYFFEYKDKARTSEVGSYTSSWLLTKIRSASQTDSIVFNYIYYAQAYNETFSSYTQTSDKSSSAGVMKRNDTNISFDGYTFLKDIRFKNGIVKFEYLGDRQDIRKYKLANMGVYQALNGLETLQSKIEFVYNYFVTPNSPTGLQYNRRLKLSELRFYGKNNSYLNNYKFDYDAENLPSYYDYNYQASTSFPTNSLGVDYWGYYNGQSNNHLIPSLLFGAAANREPDEQFMKAAIIKKITYPTGGSSEFEFEANRLRTGPNATDIKIVGGLRISKLTTRATASESALVRTYQYENGQLLTDGINSPSGYVFPSQYFEQQSSGNCNYGLKYIDNYTSTPFMPQASQNGSPIVYSQVIELQSNLNGPNLKTEYWYDAAMDREIELHVPAEVHGYVTYEAVEKRMLVDRSWERGNLLQTIYYKYQNGSYVKTKSLSREYESKKTGSITAGVQFWIRIPGIYSPAGGCLPIINSYIWYDKYVDIGVKKLVSMMETDYDDNEMPTSRRFTGTKYNATNHLFPTEEYSFNSKGDSLKTYFRYPMDLVGQISYEPPVGNCLRYMVKKNIINEPVEIVKTSFKNNIEYVTNASTKIFTPINIFVGGTNKSTVKLLRENEIELTQPLPKSNYHHLSFLGIDDGSELFDEDPNMKLKHSFLKYDQLGSPSEYYFKVFQRPQSYIWDKDGVNLMAHTQNTGVADVAYTSFERGGEKGGWIYEDSVSYDNQRIPGIYQSTSAITGKNVFNLSEGNSSVSKNNLDASKTYIVSFFYASNVGVPSVNGTLKVDQAISGLPMRYAEYEVKGVTSVNVGGVDRYIDELRLYPKGAQMTTYTYEPLIGVTSMTDAKCNTSYYEYDDFQRLKNIRDAKRNILKNYCYNYAGQQTGCPVSSTVASQSLIQTPTGQITEPEPTNNQTTETMQPGNEMPADEVPAPSDSASIITPAEAKETVVTE